MVVSIFPWLTLLFVVNLWLQAWNELSIYALPLGVQEDNLIGQAVMEYVGVRGVLLNIKGLAYGSLFFLRDYSQYVLCGGELLLTAVRSFVPSVLPWFFFLFFL